MNLVHCAISILLRLSVLRSVTQHPRGRVVAWIRGDPQANTDHPGRIGELERLRKMEATLDIYGRRGADGI